MLLSLRKYYIQDLVILAADINEHVIDGVLLKALRNLDLIEAHAKKLNLPGLASHITSRKPIDSIWVSPDVTLAEASMFLYKFGVGDHRVILVDFNFDPIIEQSTNICTLLMRKLICENKKLIES